MRRLACGLLLLCLTGVFAIHGAAADDRIRVALAADRDRVTIRSTGDLAISVPHGRRTIARTVAVRLAPMHSSRRHAARLLVNGAPTEGPVRLVAESAPLEFEGAQYRGSVVVAARAGGLLVINDIGIEDYVKGVVPSEIPAGWPWEALKAQAIVARTYALYRQAEQAHPDFDVDATRQSQVYGGIAREDPRASEAVDATAGWVVTFDRRLALTPYHSTSAGPTEDAAVVWGIDLAYLKGVDCPFDEQSSVYRWERRFTFERIEAALRRYGYRVGSLATFTPLATNRSGRVAAVRILHADGELVLSGETLRRALGYQDLLSMRFDVADIAWSADEGEAHVLLRGGGWGHGVGLCQWGMKTLAERGWSAERIIGYYYPGTGLTTAWLGAGHAR